MAFARINHAALNGSVQNAVNGLVARIIEDETKKAQARVQERIAAETRGLVAQVVMDTNKDYGMSPEVNVIISIPDAKA